MQNNCGSDGERVRYAQMQSIKCEPTVFGKRTAHAAGLSFGLEVDSDGQDDGQEGECEGDMDADADVDPDQGSSDEENSAATGNNNSGAAACSAAASAAISISAAAASGSAGSAAAVAPAKKTPPSNGKKTKGRVKIKMEFIDNKLRRYTTFSKRKTGIMKKAYELSTLTGTQVMLLVASETGHVYTFATRKLQPMITSDAGKVLIQTCLNSPDPPVGPSHQPDQRMSATGFEETDLSYTIGDEDGAPTKGERTPPAYHDQSMSVSQQHHHHHHHHHQQQQHATTVSVSGMVGVRVPSPTPTKSVSVHLPSGFTTLLSPGSVMMPPGSHGSSGATTTTSATTTTAASTTSSAAASGTVMYQTAQGVVYTTPTTAATLPEGVIFNFGQISQEQGGNGGTQQQFITIPVSLTSTPQRHKH